MNGLQVRQIESQDFSQFKQPPGGTSFVTPDAQPLAAPIYISNYRPNQLAAAMTAPTLDSKIYLRQQKVNGVFTNQSNTPVYITMLRGVVRKNIPQTEFSSWNAIFANQAISPNTPIMAVTTSQIAQRYIKFISTKVKYMPSGAMRKFKLNKKFYTPKLINTEIEVDTLNYFAIKGSQVLMLKVTPVPRLHYSGTPPGNTPTGQSWGSWDINARWVTYTSFYVNGLNDPTSTAGINVVPSEAGIFNIYTDTVSQGQAIQ